MMLAAGIITQIISEEVNTINGDRKGKIAPILYKDLRLASWEGIYHQLKPVLERLFGGAQ